ncbi:uncharacterized protein [Littorina saxatilis]|uniref:uncharacterized protein n=1 Tax=Littorina saxatilis TaxID=31220 RepID=UPI0038B43D00
MVCLCVKFDLHAVNGVREMGPHFFTLILVVVLSCKETSGITMMMEQLGLREKEDQLPRTWFPEDPRCRPEKCPVPLSGDWSRMNGHCCKDSMTFFHCQKTDAKHVVSFCMDAVQCPAGTYADLEVIIMRTYPEEPLCQKCPSLEFQPTQTASYMFHKPQCHHRRRLCQAVNADNVVFGKADADDVCRCPHYLNYRPVPLADNDCMLFKSSSGCKCEHKPCPKGQTMTATGYQCMDTTLAKTLDSFYLPQFDSLLHEGRLLSPFTVDSAELFALEVASYL